MNYPVLIAGYKRSENIKEIMRRCAIANVSSIYLALDGFGSDELEHGYPDVFHELEDFILSFRDSFSGEVFIKRQVGNIGCAASIISSCDWIFSQEEHGVVLEDDCIPSEDFFIFVQIALEYLPTHPDVWIAAGSQFYPHDYGSDDWSLSQFPMVWGWATTSKNWLEIKAEFLKGYDPLFQNLRRFNQFKDLLYWSAGARRAYRGATDVWDAILSHKMTLRGKYCLLPRETLVSNVGNDSFATHTIGSSELLHRKTGRFRCPTNPPELNKDQDNWFRKNIYNITVLRFLTIPATYLLDSCFSKRRYKLNPLIERISNSSQS